MKKTIKSSLLLIVMAVILFALTGCANSKLVATKSNSESGMKYEEKIEITFKNKLANKFKMTMEFEDESTAKMLAEYLKDEEGFKQDGKKIIYEMNVEEYAKQEGVKKEELTRDYLKKELEKDGYKVK